METIFDPYLEWLQIPADRRPPTHYDMLGLATFDPDCKKAYDAAMQRMEVVRRYQMGGRSQDALKLIAELSKACDHLTSPERKAVYDRLLKGEGTVADRPVRFATVADKPTPAPRSGSPDELVAAEAIDDLQPLESVQPLDAVAVDDLASDLSPPPRKTSPGSSALAGTSPFTTLPPSRLDASGESTDRKYQVLAGLLATVAVAMLVAGGWIAVRWWSGYVSGHDESLAANRAANAARRATTGANGQSPSTPATGGFGTPDSTASTIPGAASTNPGESSATPSTASSPNAGENPAILPGTTQTWSGTLEDLVCSQHGWHLVLRLAAPMPSGDLRIEGFSPTQQVLLRNQLTEYVSEQDQAALANPLPGDRVIVRGTVVDSGRVAGAPAGFGGGFGGGPMVPSGMNLVTNSPRLASGMPLIQLLEIEREGVPNSKTNWVNPELTNRAPVMRFNSDWSLLGMFLRHRYDHPLAAGESITIEGVLERTTGTPAMMVVRPTLAHPCRHVVVRLPGYSAEWLEARGFNRGTKVHVEGATSPESLPAQWIMTASSITNLDDPMATQLLAKADSVPSTGPGGAPASSTPAANSSRGAIAGTTTHDFSADETAWQTLWSNAATSFGKRITLKAHYTHNSPSGRNFQIHVRFRTRSTEFTARSTPELTSLLGKLSSNDPIEFEAVATGGSSGITKFHLVWLSRLGDGASKVTLPVSLPVAMISERSQTILSAAWCGAGDQVAVGFSNSINAVYDASTGQQIALIPGNNNSSYLRSSPDGSILALNSTRNDVQFWNLREQKDLLKGIVQRYSPHVIAFTSGHAAGSPLVAVAGVPPTAAQLKRKATLGPTVKVFDLNTGREFDDVTSTGGVYSPTCVAWSEDGKALAIGTSGQGVFLAQRMPKSISAPKSLAVTGFNNVDAIRLLPNNDLAILSLNRLSVWNTGTVRTNQQPQPRRAIALTTDQLDQCLSKDSTKLAMAVGAEIRYWDLTKSGNPALAAQGQINRPGAPAGNAPVLPGAGGFGGGGPFGPGVPGNIGMGANQGPANLLANDPGEALAGFEGSAAVPAPGGVDDFDPGFGVPPRSRRIGAGSSSNFTCVGWSANGNYLAAADSYGQVIVADVKSDKSVLVLGPAGTSITSLIWSPNGSRLASVLANGSVAIWDTSSLAGGAGE